LKNAIVMPMARRSFQNGVQSFFELVVSVARRLLAVLTEVRQYLDPVFKEPAPELGLSIYGNKAALSSISPSVSTLGSGRTGAQRYGRSRLLSSPFSDFFFEIGTSPSAVVTRPAWSDRTTVSQVA